jgi:hypothetical protein
MNPSEECEKCLEPELVSETALLLLVSTSALSLTKPHFTALYPKHIHQFLKTI